MRIVELPWQADPTLRFQGLAHRPWAVLLDSCCDQSGQGRYDIFTADPYATFESRGNQTIWQQHGERQVRYGNPFEVLAEQLGEPMESAGDLPFCGGAIGYWAYEAGRRSVGLNSGGQAVLAYPEMAFGLYDWAVVQDHQQRKCYWVAQDRVPQTRLIWEELQACLSKPEGASVEYRILDKPRSNFNRDTYAAAFQVIQDYIQAGDCYQVNLAQRFAAPSEGSLWAAYQKSRVLNPAPYSAYFHHPQLEISSASPECFLQVHDSQVITRPIKGTLRRREGDEEGQRTQLRNSAKDCAENLMIVDLLRNDLSKNCKPGSVTVPKLFEVESFATVHHLVSTVRGELRAGRHVLELLEGCFPGGSITGAPKRRAMEIIEQLEPVTRGIYCGSLGYIGFDGNMDSNIAIRTMVQAQGETSFYAGGGITYSSNVDAEYQECLDKAAAMQAVLEAYL